MRCLQLRMGRSLGGLEEAAIIYRWFMPLLELDIHSKLVQYIKLAESMTGIGSEHVRAPRLTLIGEEREQVVGIIKSALSKRPPLPANFGKRSLSKSL